MARAGHQMAETDPELGANLMLFFCRDWSELSDVPDLDRLLPDLAGLVARLKAGQANQYRIFRFDPAGGIRAAFVFLRMDRHMQAAPADVLALRQIGQVLLLGAEAAGRERAPLAVQDGRTVLRPEIAGLIRAAYDPVLPVAAADAAHALRLYARMQAGR